MIPCIATVFINKIPLLLRLWDSVDRPVEHRITVNNCYGALLVKDCEILGLGKNTGTAGGWNMIQDRVFNQLGLPWVLIVGSDTQFHPGDLERFEKTVNDFPEADFLYGPLSYNHFIVKRSGWEKIGAFDENCPVYLSDSAHWQTIRMTHSVKCVHVAGLRTIHEGSASIKGDPALAAQVKEWHERSWDYYCARFGCDRWSEGKETFKTPFNDPKWPANRWKLTEQRMKEPHYFSSNPIV